MTVVGPAGVEAVLAERLLVVQQVLCPRDESSHGVDSLHETLVALLASTRDSDDPAAAWLLVVGLTGAFPPPDLVRSVRRAVSIKAPDDAALWLLDAVAPLAMKHGEARARLRIVTDRPLVDVDFTAKSDFLTGIQRVVRNVVAHWDARHEVEFVVRTPRGGAYRGLKPVERARLLGTVPDEGDQGQRPAVRSDHEVVVPWRVPVVLTEVPPAATCDRLAALAELTATSVRLVGYDCIPVASAETVPLAEPEKFGRYLELVKFSDRLAAISRTAADEFEGFNRALAAQGLSGPQVAACPLPHTIRVGVESDVPGPERPVVVCVGTVGRRKNQVAVVEAAEMLWRQGLDFELRLFGHLSAERSPLAGLIPELQRLNRPLVLESGVSDARIAETLEHARCLVFPSLHEGFGLPIVEALSHGVPVITSDSGSMREVAEGQGGLLVDPEDVDALAVAMRSLLTDDTVHARLVAEARARPARAWGDYADELWEVLLS